MHDMEAAERVRQMEQCFDALQVGGACEGDLRDLTQYYESGQWLRDYELDEQGLLPPDLKRGVLAQDAVYDFLDRISKKT